MTYERLTLILPRAEMQALRSAARQELRKPRDHARHILRSVLLHDNRGIEVEVENGSTKVYEAHAAVPATVA